MRPVPLTRLFQGMLLLLAAGCGGRPALQGALSDEERREYVEQTGALIPYRLQQPFMKGVADTGMTREMVVFLSGRPHRTETERYGLTWTAYPDSAPSLVEERDSIWVYYGSDSVTVKRGMVFRGDTVSRITGDLDR
jgi:hypothetical protein